MSEPSNTSRAPTLDERLREAAAKHGNESEGHADWYMLGAQVLLHFCGDDWCTRHARPTKDVGSYLGNGVDPKTGNIKDYYWQRVVTLADNLYRLKEVKGFPLLIERLKTRDIRSVYFEAAAAAALHDAGYAVSIREEVGVKGQDFDFDVTVGDAVLSAEVTAKEEDSPFTAQSILNTLEQKRKQLPVDRPSVLFVVIPETWTLVDGSASYMPIVTNEFLRSSRRVNVVVYMWTAWLRTPEGMNACADVFNPYFNNNPRHPMPDLGYVLRRGSERDYLSLKAEIVTSDESARALEQHWEPLFATEYLTKSPAR